MCVKCHMNNGDMQLRERKISKKKILFTENMGKNIHEFENEGKSGQPQQQCC